MSQRELNVEITMLRSLIANAFDKSSIAEAREHLRALLNERRRRFGRKAVR